MVRGRLSTAAIYPLRWTCRCPRDESVIWEIIMFLKEPETPINPRTKTTPMVMREAVNSVLLLYRSRLRMAILKRLPIVLSSLSFFPDQFPVFQLLSKSYQAVGRRQDEIRTLERYLAKAAPEDPNKATAEAALKELRGAS